MAGLLGRAHLWYGRQGRRGTSALTITGPTAFANGVNLELLGLSDNVSLTGSVSQEEVPDYLVRSHVLVVPSYYEAFGIAYLEAMGFGLPVIATTAGGAHEIIKHGDAGFLIPPGDADMLARYLDQVNQDRDRLFEMSLSAYERANSHPTWDESFVSVREFLRSLATNQALED
jgi:glycosyltransferase involved in cell wall biosynthesis